MKKKLISLLLFFVLAFSSVMMVSAAETLEEPKEWENALTVMSGTEAMSHIGDENSVFIDLRASEDYEAGHIKGTVSAPVCLPASEGFAVNTDTRDAFIAKMAELKVAENDTTIYLSCYVGTFCVNYAADWLVDNCDVNVEQLIRVAGGQGKPGMIDGDPDLAAACVWVSGEQAVSVIEDKANYQIIDVRAAEKYAVGHLKNSISLPLFRVVDGGNVVVSDYDNDELAQAFMNYLTTKADTNKTIYILCNGGRSGVAAAFDLTAKAGYAGKVLGIEGGAGGATVSANLNFVTGEYAVSKITDREGSLIIDVRAEELSRKGHLWNAICLPLFDREEGKNIPVTAPYEDDLSKAFLAYVQNPENKVADKTVYIVCNSGQTGVKNAFALCEKVGLDMSNVFGISGGAAGTETDKSVPNNFKFVSGKQAVSVIEDKENYLIIDVRAKEKHAAGHLKNSVSLPLFTLNAEGGNVPVAAPYEDDLSKAFLSYVQNPANKVADKTVYFLCNSGQTGVKNSFALAEKAGLTNVFGISGGAAGVKNNDMTVPANLNFVTADYFLGEFTKDTTVLIDVRAKEVQANNGFIAGSISLPLFTWTAEGGNSPVVAPYEDDLSKAFLAYIKDNKDFFADKTVYILCNSGQTGVKNAFALAEKAGLDNVFGITGGATNESLKAIFTKDSLAVASAKLGSKKLTYTGKALVPTLTIKDANGKKLVEGTDFVKVIYNASGKKVTSPKAVGTYTIKVTYKGEYIRNAQSELTYKIAPKAVTNLKAKLTAYSAVKVTWTKSTGATAYRVYYKKASAKSYTDKNSKVVTGTSATFKALNAGTKYTFKVVPLFGKDKEAGLKATTVSKTTLKKVANVKVVRNGKKVKVSWTNINGETGYQISRSTKKSGTDNVKTFKGADLKNKTITISKPTKYYYKVRAYKVEGDKKIYGPWSAVVYK